MLNISALPEIIMTMAHANRPARVFPITGIAEYAQSGGEAVVAQNGYGGNQITGYSPLIETWTLESDDDGIRQNLMRLKNLPMRVFYIDQDSTIYAEDAGSGKIKGFKTSSVYPSGQRFRSSGTNAALAVNISYTDVEGAYTKTKILTTDDDILSDITGLLWVDVISTGTGKYKLVEHYGGNNDITGLYGTALAVTTAWTNVTAATYNASDETLSLTTTSGEPKLALPSVLYGLGIKGIEQL